MQGRNKTRREKKEGEGCYTRLAGSSTTTVTAMPVAQVMEVGGNGVCCVCVCVCVYCTFLVFIKSTTAAYPKTAIAINCGAMGSCTLMGAWPTDAREKREFIGVSEGVCVCARACVCVCHSHHVSLSSRNSRAARATYRKGAGDGKVLHAARACSLAHCLGAKKHIHTRKGTKARANECRRTSQG